MTRVRLSARANDTRESPTLRDALARLTPASAGEGEGGGAREGCMCACVRHS